MKLFNTHKLIILSTFVILITSCTKHPDSPGYEYVWDMYRSQAIEAYVDYGLVGDVEHPELKSKMSARNPVKGSIQYIEDRNMAEIFMPFNYGEGEEERERAGREVTIPGYYISDTLIAAENLAEGKRLYNLMCTHCHGAKGEGDGKVITVGEYPSTPPAYTTLKELDGSSKTLGSCRRRHRRRMLGCRSAWWASAPRRCVSGLGKFCFACTSIQISSDR